MTEQRFGECDGYFRRDGAAALASNPNPCNPGGAGEGPADPAAVAHFRRLLARHPAMAARHSAARLLAKHAPEALLRGIAVRTPPLDSAFCCLPMCRMLKDLGAAVEQPLCLPLKRAP